MKEEIIDIKEQVIELLENKRYSNLHNYIDKLNSQDISQLFEELSKEDMALVFRLLAKDEAAEVFSYLEPDLQEDLISLLTDKELKIVVDDLFMDDTVDLIEEMPSNVVKRILKGVNQKDRKLINELLKYPADSAGSIMTTEFVDLKINMTVEEAFKKIKKIALDKETVYTCYVLDTSRKIVGIVDVKSLLLADNETRIKEIMETNVITVNTLDDKEDVAKKFDKYDFMALPVVDKEERLVGIITVDDAMDVLQEENTEDFEYMAGIIDLEQSDKEYLDKSVFQHVKARLPWLLMMMVALMLTGAIISGFEEILSQVIVLVSYMPLLMGMGGNTGSQASTLIVRGLALNEVELEDTLKVLWKEFRISFCVGAVLSLCNFIKILLLDGQPVTVALTVCISLILIVAFAKCLGGMVPLLAKKLNADPALMANPVIASLTDMVSVLIYFMIAKIVLGI